jgi:predicted nucleotidyltransferase
METRKAPIDAALSDLKYRLRSLLGPSLVRLDLFGSRARGDESEESDIDVAVVVRALDGSLRERILAMVADVELEHRVPLSTVLVSEEDFRELGLAWPG